MLQQRETPSGHENHNGLVCHKQAKPQGEDVNRFRRPGLTALHTCLLSARRRPNPESITNAFL